MAQVHEPFSQRWSGTLPGDLYYLANTSMTCASPGGTPATCATKNDSISMINAVLPADAGDPAIFNSSSSDLTTAWLPAGATVVKAQLYWGGLVVSDSGAPSPDPLTSQVKFATPVAPYADLTATHCAVSPETNTWGQGSHFLYQCTTDVTAAVQAGGLGTYKVANIPVQSGVVNRFGGWTLAVVVRKPGGTMRNFTLNDGMAIIRNVSGATTVSVPISGFTTPITGPVNAQIGAVVYDGDFGAADSFTFQATGPSVALSDACNPANDEFNSTICHLGSVVTTRSTVNNNLNNTVGYDADIIQLDNTGNANLGNGATSATITASTPSEGYFIGMVSTAIDVYQPAFEGVGVKTQANVTHPGLPAGYAYPGDTLRYTIVAENIGEDTATDVVVEDAIPAGTSYVPGSLVVVAGANAGAKTDAAGDDQAEYDAGGPLARFRIGQGADATNGGVIRCPTCPGTEPTSSTIQFDVIVDAAATPGTVIANTAHIEFDGLATGDSYETDTNDVETTIVVPAVGVAKQAGAVTDNGDGTFTVPLTFTVENLSPASAGAAGALSNVQVVDDLAATFPAPATFTVGPVSATGTLAANPAFDGSSDTNLLDAASSTLAAGATATITVDVTFNPHGLAGPFNNQAVASADDAAGDPVTDTSNNGTDPDPNDNGNPDDPGENETTPIAGVSADLDLAKTVDVASPPVGSNVTYTLTVTNAGPNSTAGVTVTDVLPSGLAYVSSGGVGSYDDATGVWTVGTLASGASAQLTITATVLASGSYANVAEVASSDVPDPDSTPGNGASDEDDYATVTIAPIPVANVSIVKTGPATVASGGTISYQLTISNAGPSAADGAAYSDTVPAAITGVTASCGSPAGGAACAVPNVAGNVVSGTVPVLPAGGSVVITIDGTAPTGEQSLSNTASVTPPGGTTDPDPSDDSSTVDTDVAASADIEVTKSVDESNPNVGEDVTFTITVTNHGPDDATGVVVTDSLPAGLVYVSSNPSQGTYDDATGAWTIGAIANGASVTLEIVATVDQPGSITNTATRTAADQADPDNSNNSGSASVNGQPSADLQVLKMADDMTPNVGDTVTYTITLTNAGPNDATGVTIDDPLPTEVTFVSATPSQGTYDNATGVWTVGSVPAGTSVTLDIEVTIDVAGPITNTASVASSDQFDPNTANNSGGVTVAGQSADLQVVKTVDDKNPQLGDTIAFTITVTNNGPSDATNVEIDDPLPAEVTFVGATPSQGSYDDATGIWTVGTLTATGPTATATLTITATVESVDGFTNTASVGAADQPDPVPSNDSSTVPVNPQASADVSIVKTAPADVASGATITYTLLIANDGPSPADGAAYQDIVPAAITNVAASCGTPTGGAVCSTPTVAGNTVSGNVATFPAGSSVTITITGDAPVGATTLDNTATVEPPAGTDDPDPSDNSSDTSTDVAAAADIAIDKVVDDGAPTVGDTITFTITATNNGPDAATGVTVTDPLPAGLTFVSATASQGAYVAGTGVWTVGTLANGATATLDIQATVDVDTGIVNTATYSGGDVDDPDSTNDSDSATVGPVAAADLVVAKTGPASVTAGGNVTYTVVVTNNGPSSATNVVIADPTPAGLVFVGNTGDCVTAYPCTIATLASGASATVSSTYTVPAGYAGPSPIVNTATASSDVDDPVPGNNSGSAQTDVVIPVAEADLGVTKTGPASVNAGGTVSYTIVVTNAGPDAATNVVVDDPTPAGLVFSGNTGDCATAYPCTFASLAAGASLTITSTYQVPVGYAGPNPIVNTATAGSDVDDPNGGNDSGTAETQVVIVVPASADLGITKTGPATVEAGQTITYTLVVTNAGPDPVPDAVVTDPTPAGLTFQSASAPCTTGFPCTVGAIAVGGSVSITATYVVDADHPGGVVVNTASVASATVPDPTPANDASTVATTVTTGGGPQPGDVRPVPVDARWMLILMGALLVLVGAAGVRRQRR